MKCNMCEHEMVKGFIPVIERKLKWIPDEVNNPFFDYVPKGGINIQSPGIFFIEKKEAYHCHRCEVIIIPVKDKKREF